MYFISQSLIRYYILSLVFKVLKYVILNQVEYNINQLKIDPMNNNAISYMNVCSEYFVISERLNSVINEKWNLKIYNSTYLILIYFKSDNIICIQLITLYIT